jgi:hypothetical protein
MPAGLFRGMQLVMRPFAPAASNVMGMNHLIGITETPWTGTELPASSACRTCVRFASFLAEEAALPDRS